MASKLRESNAFGHSASTSDVRKAGIWLHRPKHLQSKFEDPAIKFEGDVKSGLEAWIKKNYHGLVGHKTFDSAGDFAGADVVTALYNVDYEKNPKVFSSAASFFLKKPPWSLGVALADVRIFGPETF